VLRAARLAVPQSPPVLRLNMGRLGFLTELTPRDLFNRFEADHGPGLAHRRACHGEPREIIEPSGRMSGPYDALNDIVVSRQAPGRPTLPSTFGLDRAKVANYPLRRDYRWRPRRGAPRYSLSAGGPILAPNEHHLVLTRSLPPRAGTLRSSSTATPFIDLLVTSDHGLCSAVDGQEDVPIMSGASESPVRMSEHVHPVRDVPPDPILVLCRARGAVLNSSCRAL